MEGGKINEFGRFDFYLVRLEYARIEAAEVLAHTVAIADEFCATHLDREDEECRALLEDVSYNIMKIATLEELK